MYTLYTNKDKAIDAASLIAAYVVRIYRPNGYIVVDAPAETMPLIYNSEDDTDFVRSFPYQDAIARMR